jgi:hypothetical protein
MKLVATGALLAVGCEAHCHSGGLFAFLIYFYGNGGAKFPRKAERRLSRIKNVAHASPLRGCDLATETVRVTTVSTIPHVGAAALPRDRGEDEKGAAGCPEKQAYDPKAGSFCKRGDCRDRNRDLEHGHAAREHFVLMKV